MAVSASVTGAAHLREVQARLLKAPATLDEATVRRLRPVPAKVADLVRAEVPTHLPAAYAPLLAKSIRYRSSVSKHGLSMQVWAAGKRDRRDLPTINQGRLRHPLFGRRTHWYTTRVRRGTVDDALTKAGPIVVDAVKSARDDVAHSITR
jgi:hypothetical protein